MVKDYLQREITRGNFVAYGVSSGDIKVRMQRLVIGLFLRV